MRLHPVCLTLVAALVTAGSAAAAPVQETGDSVRTYDFNDLSVDCNWFTTMNGYDDLAFPASAYLSRCVTPNGTVGLRPSALAGGRVEVRVVLPAPASAVSIESFLFDFGDAPALIAYDETGAELGRAEDATIGAWVTLSVEATSENPIASIGLYMPQLVVDLDNLTVDYGFGSTQEEPLPEPQGEGELPQASDDPVVRADCEKGGWEVFGFRNQGQCVRFVRTGVDSR